MNENIKIKFNANFFFTGLESLTPEKEAREGNGVDVWVRLIFWTELSTEHWVIPMTG